MSSLLVPARLLELRRFLRRRLPADLVDDVAQSAACEAWAGRHKARGEGFLFGVARHEAYDALRARGPCAGGPCAGGPEVAERSLPEGAADGQMDPSAAPAVPATSLAHAELSEVLDYVEARPHLHDPLKWLVREHEGDSFEDIAVEQGLSPAAVRQRVSRLRRELRVAFAVVMTAVIAIGAIAAARHATDGAVAFGFAPVPVPVPIPPSPQLAPAIGESASDGLSDEWLTGSWKVASTTDPRVLPFLGARIDLSPDHAEISLNGWRKATTFSRHGTQADVAVSGHVAGKTESVTLQAVPRGLRIEGPFGSALLTRIQ